MTIRFLIKQKKHEAPYRSRRQPVFNSLAYLYVRIRDGRAVDQTVRTSILVCPEWWSRERESIRTNSACPEAEMITVNKAVNELRNHLVADYIADRAEKCITDDWLKKEIDGFGHRLRLHGRLDKLSGEFPVGLCLGAAILAGSKTTLAIKINDVTVEDFQQGFGTTAADDFQELDFN